MVKDFIKKLIEFRGQSGLQYLKFLLWLHKNFERSLKPMHPIKFHLQKKSLEASSILEAKQ